MNGIQISKRSFLIAIGVIFLLMALTYALTFVIPGGAYSRTVNAEGQVVIDPSDFRTVEGGLPFWKWLLSPILVLAAEGSGTLIAVLVFLVVIGGVFNALAVSGLMNYLLARIVERFGSVKYKLMSALILFFMGMGSLIGSFEEIIPMAPIVVALSVALGWDAVTGVAMSLLAAGCGFAAGIANPFTIGVAQGLAGIPMFSGAGFRILSFVLIYLLLLWFVRRHAHRADQGEGKLPASSAVQTAPRMDRALKIFGGILSVGILLVLSSGFIKALQDLTMIIVALTFLLAGLLSVRVSGMRGGALARAFGQGIFAIAPSVLMILMASSIKYTMEEGHILDTLLHAAAGTAGTMPKGGVILFIYAICLIMNFFIASGSAKAFLLIPIIAPLAQLFGISVQLAIVAFAFGDGFSNVIYPTNAGLLITLGLSNVSYGDWFRYSVRFQLLNLILTSAILLFGLAIGY